MCVGLVPADRVTRARARTTGHAVVLFGSTTGRDGIGGASVLASQELGEESHEKRPSVQIGDPFTGKKLIETSLELVESGAGRVPPGSRRGRPRLIPLGDGARRRRPRRPPRPRPAARGGDGAVGDHDLGEPGAHGRRRPPGAPRARQGGMRALGARVGRDRDRHRHRRAAVLLRRRGRGRDPRRFPDGGGPALRGPAHAASAGSGGAGAEGAGERGGAARAPALPEHPQPRLDLPSLRPPGRLAHGQAARARRRRPAPAAVAARTGRLARRLRPSLPARPANRRRGRRPRSGAQRGLRRWRAARLHRLPELRQPRARRDRLGAGGVDRGHCGGVRGARSADRVRERLALQRDGGTADPPDAGGRLRGARR